MDAIPTPPAARKVKRLDSKLLGSLPTKRDPYDRIEIQNKVTRRVADYVKDGVVVLRDVVSSHQMDALRQAANQVGSPVVVLQDVI